jgi:hypothetical protein
MEPSCVVPGKLVGADENFHRLVLASTVAAPVVVRGDLAPVLVLCAVDGLGHT